MGNKQILKLAHIPSSLILPASQICWNLPRELTSQTQHMLNWTTHSRPVLQRFWALQATSKIWFPMPTPYLVSR